MRDTVSDENNEHHNEHQGDDTPTDPQHADTAATEPVTADPAATRKRHSTSKSFQ